MHTSHGVSTIRDTRSSDEFIKALAAICAMSWIVVLPLRADEMACRETKIVASDSSLEGRFGTSIALGGDFALIGAPVDA